ncbi:hypothetical protein AB0I52_09430 [Streptomyces sp. NPDC050423]|uniref:hypothetical protein n=1 Tax=Streptomyces sp. NPDC050423 TaxID=3155402 RepID=UPI00342D8F7F
MACALGDPTTFAAALEGVEGLLRHWAATDGSPAEVTGDTEKLTGRPARAFGAWAAEHAAAFRA